jgi:hypothetical protein
MVAGFISERRPASNRNRWPDCVGIRNPDRQPRRGDAREDSDYDLVVVLDDEVPDEFLSARRRYEGRRGLTVSADIIPCRDGVLKERARAIGSFAHTVLNEGIVVYERS